MATERIPMSFLNWNVDHAHTVLHVNANNNNFNIKCGFCTLVHSLWKELFSALYVSRCLLCTTCMYILVKPSVWLHVSGWGR